MHPVSLPVLTAVLARRPILALVLETIQTEQTEPYPGCGQVPGPGGALAHGIGKLAVLAVTDALGHLRDAGWIIPATAVDEAIGEAAGYPVSCRYEGGPGVWVRLRVVAA